MTEAGSNELCYIYSSLLLLLNVACVSTPEVVPTCTQLIFDHRQSQSRLVCYECVIKQ